MKINDKRNQIKTFEVVTSLKGIDRYFNTREDGSEYCVIRLKTKDGNYSNFESIWNRQHIDAESLDENAMIKITYTKFLAKTCAEIKNFIKVELV